jgi:hypothetical protein
MAANLLHLVRGMYKTRALGYCVMLLSAFLSAITASGQSLIIVDAGANTHLISDLVYGVNFANSNQLAELNSPLNRCGGNAETRYNWNANAHNRGGDWFFESIADATATPGAYADDHIDNSKSAGADAMITIPMIGWVAKDRTMRWSYSVAKYGAQDATDFWQPDAGNGALNGVSITNNDPTDANVLLNSTDQQNWVKHLTNRWGAASQGGVRYYLMDNEPSLWSITHIDVHHQPLSLHEERDRLFDYAGKVKATDPSALICGPEEWGWTGYFYSGVDALALPSGPFPDRTANSNMDYVPWLLDQAHQYELTNGTRLLDVLTVHFYPQGNSSGGVQEFGTNVTTAAQTLRNRSTRALWDTNYTDASWIQDVVKLVPRFKQWISTYYPGTKFGLTEYSWGADDHINGATAQADVLGILGREGVDLATRWVVPSSNSPVANAFKMYRNYDGNKSKFGETSATALVPNADNVSAFAATRAADRALTVMLINKQLTNSASIQVSLTNFYHNATAQLWQLTSTNVITPLGSWAFTGNAVTATLPPQSITLMVLPPGNPPQLSATQTNASTVTLTLNGYASERYVIESSTNAATWTPIATNLLSSNSLRLNFSITNSARFYRAYWTTR